MPRRFHALSPEPCYLLGRGLTAGNGARILRLSPTCLKLSIWIGCVRGDDPLHVRRLCGWIWRGARGHRKQIFAALEPCEWGICLHWKLRIEIPSPIFLLLSLETSTKPVLCYRNTSMMQPCVLKMMFKAPANFPQTFPLWLIILHAPLSHTLWPLFYPRRWLNRS
jgi:hypothetical protein